MPARPPRTPPDATTLLIVLDDFDIDDYSSVATPFAFRRARAMFASSLCRRFIFRPPIRCPYPLFSPLFDGFSPPIAPAATLLPVLR